MDHKQYGYNTRMAVGAIKPGPVRHHKLSEQTIARIRRLHEVFAEVDETSLAERIDSFKRDQHPEVELDVWERIMHAYERFCRGMQLTREAKTDIFNVALMRSMSTEAEVLQQLELKILSEEDAREFMKAFQ